ncbi:hypothetical protein QYS49_38630 [Marivirga salinae]|uniref:Uncharacterized protein n=1 Tax=Marivirga salinarum TaxID=3059078 RepID=A0AA51NAR5_9BACT|nr:hypothetical protein [Marivirga sp. BDSF4-3]WMN11510.1 hypothetical protein QYS49_38630 [Marivirga sp. BDSF4-3]
MIERIEIDKKDYLSQAENYIQQWYDLIQQRKLEEAVALCQAIILPYKEVLNKRNWHAESENDYNNFLVLAIIFKAFEDYSQLGKITLKNKWDQDNLNLENVWLKLWDSKDRLDSVRGRIQSKIVELIYSNLEDLLDQYRQNFGNGLYASPEILIKKELCSICNKDIRACSHIKGRWYNGIICRGIAEDIEMKTISLVTVPRDPRCRVWPWREKEDRVFEMPVLTLFQVDDFLNDY